MNNQKEFKYTFRVEKRISFVVSYYTLGSNKMPHFSTSANLLNYLRSDYERSGQAQKYLLNKDSLAYKFFSKWDKKHLQSLNDTEYSELTKDLKELLELYPHINNGTFYGFVSLDIKYSK